MVAILNGRVGRLMDVTTPDEEGIESQHSAHSKVPQTASRIRLSWWLILIIVVLLAITATMIAIH
jgi:hypothetical protein